MATPEKGFPEATVVVPLAEAEVVPVLPPVVVVAAVVAVVAVVPVPGRH
jgi:hypothetical protein